MDLAASGHVEQPRGILQVVSAGDVVALEDARRLVARELHRHALRHAGADQFAHGAPAHIVRDATWTSSRSARSLPRLVEARDCPRLLLASAPFGHLSEEYVRENVS